MGITPLEIIELYLPQIIIGFATNMLYAASKKIYSTVFNWAKMRIKTQAREEKAATDRPVRVTLYGPTGERLLVKDIYEDREDTFKEFPF